MKAEELMVGDWVLVKLTQHLTTVTNIDINSIYTEVAFPLSLDEIEPIPLTPEILEKNGFKLFNSNEYRKEYVWFKNGERSQNYISVVFYDDGGVLVIMNNESISIDGVNRVHICDILYVHQLQHALRLCGIKKTIEL